MSTARRLMTVVIVIAAGILAAAALAAGTIDEYKAQVEPICRPGATATDRILTGVRDEVRAGDLGRAAARFERAHEILAATYRELVAVERPPAESARLGRWLSYLDTEIDLIRQVAVALRAAERNRAVALVARLNHTANLANAQIVIYGFRWCRIEPSKYT